MKTNSSPNICGIHQESNIQPTIVYRARSIYCNSVYRYTGEIHCNSVYMQFINMNQEARMNTQHIQQFEMANIKQMVKPTSDKGTHGRYRPLGTQLTTHKKKVLEKRQI